MKKLFILVVLFSPLLVINAQSLKRAEFLEPEDLGIQKYEFENQPEEDEVVILRMEYFTGKKDISNQCQEWISNAKFPPASIPPVLLYDMSAYAPEHQGDYMLKWAGGAFPIHNKGAKSLRMNHGNVPRLEIKWVGFRQNGEEIPETKLVFTCYTESYEKAKQRYPQLPENQVGGYWANIEAYVPSE